MSKFELYKSKGKSLQQLGLINKIIYFLIAAIYPFFGFSGTIFKRLNLADFVLYIVLIIWGILIISLIIYSRYINKHLEKLGDLTINLNGITKSISGLVTRFEYDKIKEINVKKHIRNIFFPSNTDGSKTYLVSIIGDDEKKEKFVISSQSIDKPEINFLDSIKNLDKFKKIKFKITK